MTRRNLQKATERFADDPHFRLQVEHTVCENCAERVLEEFHLTLEERESLVELAAAEAAAPFHANVP